MTKRQITIRNATNGFMIFSNVEGGNDYVAKTMEEAHKIVADIFNAPEDIKSPIQSEDLGVK